MRIFVINSTKYTDEENKVREKNIWSLTYTDIVVLIAIKLQHWMT